MLLGLGAAVQAEVLPVLRFQEVLHDVHDLCHLEEVEFLIVANALNLASQYLQRPLLTL